MVKHSVITFLVLLLLFVKGANGAVVLYEDFEDLNTGDTYGDLSSIYDLGNNKINIGGGKIVQHGGNKLVRIQGSYPDLTADMGIEIDIKNYFIDKIEFDFYFDYSETTQASLFTPTTIQADLYLLNGGKLVDQVYLFNLNYTGLQSGSMDVTPDPSNYPTPFNTSFSLTNLASYLADVSSFNPGFHAFDSAYLVLSAVYWSEGDGLDMDDPYESSVYLDNITVEATAIPEPAVCASFIFGLVFFRRIIKRVRE